MKKCWVLLILLVITAGCALLPVEDPVPPPPRVYVPQARPLRTVPVARGDVMSFVNPTAVYVPVREERLHFELAGLRVAGIYVDTGDFVLAGDVVSSLYWPDIENRLRDTLLLEARLTLERNRVVMRHEMALRFAADTGIPMDDAGYLAEMERINEEIYFLNRTLTYLREQNERRYLRASMDGTVSHVIIFTEGMVSSAMLTVATVVDQIDNIFELRSREAALRMQAGDFFTITIGQVPYRVVVINPEDYGIARDGTDEYHIYLTFADEVPVLPPRPIGFVHVPLDEALDVLYIPLNAIRRASERVFVYVLTEQGIRVIRDIELGLRGNFSYEVKNGLSEGELIILG